MVGVEQVAGIEKDAVSGVTAEDFSHSFPEAIRGASGIDLEADEEHNSHDLDAFHTTDIRVLTQKKNEKSCDVDLVRQPPAV